MDKKNAAITLEPGTLASVDRLVREAHYSSRSQAIEAAVSEKIARLKRRRLAEECAKLDRKTERSLAEEGIEADAASWPEY